MSDNTEYQPVPTTIERTDATRCRCSVSGPLICFGFILIIAGVPGILIGALKYDRANSFNAQPGLCRVNAIGTERIGTMKTSANYPVWNVDIVKQADSSDATKNFTVLRSSVLIQGTDGFKFAQRALEDAKALYSVSRPSIIRQTRFRFLYKRNLFFQFVGWQSLSLLLSEECLEPSCFESSQSD